MKKVLIIYPHWPPSNLVGVHRVRLIANELITIGWEPIVLTIDERDYEEPLNTTAQNLVDERIEVIKVRAIAVVRVFGKRLIGDIGLRGYFPLLNKALEICSNRDIDAAWISIPSWYTSLIGRHLWKKRKVPFGVDYQDPWVHDLPQGVSPFSRANLTVFLAKLLEPYAVEHATYITGINRHYFSGCLDRNPHLETRPHGELQVGFSVRDHQIPQPKLSSPWSTDERVFIYGGAFLPLSAPNWILLFQALELLCQQELMPRGIKFYLFGTGQTLQKSLTCLANENNVGHLIQEIPERIPFLELQEFMRRSEGVLSIGSIESHYSASKTFQCILSGKKILSISHPQSEAKGILEQCKAGAFHMDNSTMSLTEDTIEQMGKLLLQYFDLGSTFWKPNLSHLSKYTALESAKTLANTIESAIE